ncbi:MAG: hypothetical protein AAGH89_07870 [Verrucomicrobiota bacterium]
MISVILDECLLKRLSNYLIEDFEVTTVPQAGFAGYKNGKRLAAIKGEYDVFVTIDSNLEYQQNLSGTEIGIIVVRADSNRLESLLPKVPALLQAIDQVKPGEIQCVS